MPRDWRPGSPSQYEVIIGGSLGVIRKGELRWATTQVIRMRPPLKQLDRDRDDSFLEDEKMTAFQKSNL